MTVGAIAATPNKKDSVILKNDFGVNETKYSYEFDSKGNKLSEVVYNWNPQGQSWIPYAKAERAYNDKDMVCQETEFSWNEPNKAWIKSGLDISGYDKNGNKTFKEHYVWDKAINAWVDNYKYTIAYDEQNNQTSLKYYVWDAENEWVASTNSTMKKTGDSSDKRLATTKVSCMCE